MANGRARSLRKRLTSAEQRLWDELKLLRNTGYHFRRQAPIGPYIVDFVCFSQRLVIEVDGVGHDLPAARLADSCRDSDLRWRGFNVIRFGNGDVMEKLDGVMREVCSHLDSCADPLPANDDHAQSFPPPPTPPHQGEGDVRPSTSLHAESPGHGARLPLAASKPSGKSLT